MSHMRETVFADRRTYIILCLAAVSLPDTAPAGGNLGERSRRLIGGNTRDLLIDALGVGDFGRLEGVPDFQEALLPAVIAPYAIVNLDKAKIAWDETVASMARPRGRPSTPAAAMGAVLVVTQAVLNMTRYSLIGEGVTFGSLRRVLRVSVKL